MYQINFGAKLPVATCKIQERKSELPTDATIYEYDCKDVEDYFELEKLAKSQTWKFADIITAKANLKLYGSRANESIYAMEDENGETIGLCNTENFIRKTEVRYIESNSDKKYKYVGQAMLTYLAQKALYEGKRELTIANAQPSAFDFYKKCGFTIEKDGSTKECADFFALRAELPNIIHKTERKTKGQVINLDI